MKILLFFDFFNYIRIIFDFFKSLFPFKINNLKIGIFQGYFF